MHPCNRSCLLHLIRPAECGSDTATALNELLAIYYINILYILLPAGCKHGGSVRRLSRALRGQQAAGHPPGLPAAAGRSHLRGTTPRMCLRRSLPHPCPCPQTSCVSLSTDQIRHELPPPPCCCPFWLWPASHTLGGGGGGFFLKMCVQMSPPPLVGKELASYSMLFPSLLSIVFMTESPRGRKGVNVTHHILSHSSCSQKRKPLAPSCAPAGLPCLSKEQSVVLCLRPILVPSSLFTGSC